jgi:hypothetical protein
LLDRRRNIARVSRTHRLHGHGRVSADLELTHRDLPSFSSGDVHDNYSFGTFAFLLIPFALD